MKMQLCVATLNDDNDFRAIIPRYVDKNPVVSAVCDEPYCAS